jgi:hypothetical protein
MPSLDFYLERIPDNAPPALRQQMIADAKRKVEEDTFGVGFRRDRQGKPIEQGLGSASHPTQQSIDAYIHEQTARRAGGPEAGYEEALAAMRKRLAEYLATKRAAAAPQQE